MTKTPTRLLAFVIAFLAAGLHAPEPVEARATVEDRDLVSSRRVGRTEFLYSYTLSINNQGPALDDVKVYVSCDANGTTLVDDIVEFGDIPEDAVTTSTDTFSMRQNRRIPFDPDCLVYEIGFDTPLIISGLATDEPLANALITAIVVRPASGRPIIDSGRPIIDSYSTFADDQGNYTLEIDAVTQEDFITLEADGVGEQDEALLTSTVGSVGALHDVGTSGSIIVGSSDFGALTITHITTAQDELVRRLNGGELPTTDGELAALRSQVNGAELLTLASVIKTIIDNPNIVLPPGINNTLELIQNPVVFEQVLADLETNFPAELAEATQETAADLNIGFSPGEIGGPLYAVISDEQPFTFGSFVFDLDPNGGGSVTFNDGDSPVTWVINSAGELELTLLDPPVFESFPFVGQDQVRALRFVDQVRLVKITDGPVIDQVFALSRTVTTYPDDPQLDDIIVEDQPAPEFVYLSFGPSGVSVLTEADIAGGQYAAYYYHQDNEQTSLGAPGLQLAGADRLTFNADGTGTTARLQFGFTWSIDLDGTLDVVFDTGDRNRYLVLGDNGSVDPVIVVGTLASTGESYSISTVALEPDGVTEFSASNLANRRYRALFSVLDQEFPFDFLFLPDGTGCRIQSAEGPSEPFSWDVTALNFMDLTRDIFFSEFDEEFFGSRRSWEALTIVPGIQGDRFWVVENLVFDVSSVRDEADPETLVGRLNAYEFIEDISEATNPCGFEPESSLTTLFDSNNAGDGNMFDLNTGDSNVLIGAFDLNVDYPVGTDFEVEVYTVSGSFDDTITAPATCSFNCAFDASAWTLVATGTASSQGLDAATFFDFDDFVLPANSTTGIWIRLPQDAANIDALRYTNGAGSVGDPATLEIVLGAGLTSDGVSEGVVRNRVWNGTVYYTVQ